VRALQLCGVAAAVVMCAPAAPAQDDEEDDRPDRAGDPVRAREIVSEAIEAMGGREALARVRAAALQIESGMQVAEQHRLVLDGRLLHYSSRRASGAGFDVVLARDRAFICDRDAAGDATLVEDLDAADAVEGAYERDVLFMPLLLLALLEDPEARLDYRGPNSVGDPVVRALVRPPADGLGEPFVIRLRFDEETGLLTTAMGTIPHGADQGKKRYCSFLDYGPVGPLRLPAKVSDMRGKDAPARDYGIRWDLEPDVTPAMFERPEVVEER